MLTKLINDIIHHQRDNSTIKAKIAMSYFSPTTNKLRKIFKKHQIQLIPKSYRKFLQRNKKIGNYQISFGMKNCNQIYIELGI
jgi:hypothetical protein